MSKRKFFEEFYKSNDGAFKATNLTDAVSSGTLSRDTFQSFTNELEGELAITPAVTNPARLFDPVATKTDASGKKLFVRKGLKLKRLDCGFLATTVNAKYLRDGFSIADKRRYRSLLGLVSRFYAASSDVERHSIEDDIFALTAKTSADKDGLLSVDFDAGIKGTSRDSIIWFTSYGKKSLPECGCWKAKAEWKKRADCTRDILGLDHFGGDSDPTSPTYSTYSPTLLATLVIPTGSLPRGQEFFRPTPLDETGRRFKSCFGDLRKKPDTWGRTAHLERILSKRPHRGGREIVTTNFRPTGPILFTILGFTKVPRGDWVPLKDAEFLKSLTRGRPKDRFVERLDRLASR